MSAADPEIGGIRLEGDLTVETVNALFARTPNFSGSNTSVSLAEVTELDSAGLALLVHWQRCAARVGGRLQYVDVPDQAVSMMQVSGLAAALIGAP